VTSTGAGWNDDATAVAVTTDNIMVVGVNMRFPFDSGALVVCRADANVGRPRQSTASDVPLPYAAVAARALCVRYAKCKCPPPIGEHMDHASDRSRKPHIYGVSLSGRAASSYRRSGVITPPRTPAAVPLPQSRAQPRRAKHQRSHSGSQSSRTRLTPLALPLSTC
jgi:hypothetical protein